MHNKLYYIIYPSGAATVPEDLIEEITADRLIDGEELYGLTASTQFYTDWNTVLRQAQLIIWRRQESQS